jgi:amino acid transporter
MNMKTGLDNPDVVISLSSIGTLFAFVLVCGGVLVLQRQPDRPEPKFKVPFINAKFIVPILFLMAVVIVVMSLPGYFKGIITPEGFPMVVFWIVTLIITVQAFRKSYSLIPVLGLVSCFYLMAQESHTNWLRFFIWLIVGLVIYFFYGFWNSKLHKQSPMTNDQ